MMRPLAALVLALLFINVSSCADGSSSPVPLSASPTGPAGSPTAPPGSPSLSPTTTTLPDLPTPDLPRVLDHAFSGDKFPGYALQAGVWVEQKGYAEAADALRAGLFRGVVDYPTSHDDIGALFDAYQRGTRVLILVAAEHPEEWSLFRELWGVSPARETVVKSVQSMGGGVYTALWDGLDVGKSEFELGQTTFLLALPEYTCSIMESEETGEPRCLGAYLRQGDKEVLFLAIPSGFGADRFVFGDPMIDAFDNKDAAIRVLEWLAGIRDYPR